VPVSSILAYAQSLAAVVCACVVSYVQIGTEPERGEEGKKQDQNDQKRVVKHIKLRSKDATKDQLLCKRLYRENNGRKTTKTRTLYGRKKAEKQRVMALFALPRE
jgi:hypothetical protein